MELSRKEKEMIVTALNMRTNQIQTGDTNLSAQDAENCGLQEKIKL